MSRGTSRVLVVDDQSSFRRLLVRVLQDAGYAVDQATDGRQALAMARKQPYHLVLSDVSMPNMDGTTLLSKLRDEMPETIVVLLTAYGAVPQAVEAIKQGAFDYLIKPLPDPDAVLRLAERALAHRRTIDATASLKPSESGELVYEHPSMQRVAEMVRRVAPVDATVLVTGESGTGKELIARMIHQYSPRADKPYVPVNCAALAETLLDSELFGHEKGAFTGADASRRGRFEVADGGTLFLDEIGETSPQLQAKLLRVLQERSFERVGGNKTLEVDVRLVAATNRDLPTEVKNGAFREDLYYRLNVVPIELPALRDRGRDVVVLARHFLARHGRRLKRNFSLSEGAEAVLLSHKWPGNVRELNNVIERAAILSRQDAIGELDLALGLQLPSVTTEHDLPLNLKALERDAIERALAATEGNRRQAAELLGIGLRTLHYKLNEYGLR